MFYRRDARVRFGLVAVVLALVLGPGAGPARALSINGLVIAPTASNTASALTNSGTNRSQIESSTAVVGSASGPVADVAGASVGFDTRYAALLAVDRESTGGSVTRSATASYTIVFTIDNPLGADYRIDIDTFRNGAITLVSDGGGNATGTLGAVTGTLGGVANSMLGLAAVGPLASASSTNLPFSQSSSTLSFLQSAISQTYTLAFQWTSSASSSQDEVAIRLGMPGGLTASTADNYPGVGSRVAANDGHFVRVGATLLSLPVPEPGTALLLGSGLLLLAIGRERARSAAPRR